MIEQKHKERLLALVMPQALPEASEETRSVKRGRREVGIVN